MVGSPGPDAAGPRPALLVLRSAPWAVVLTGVLTQLAITLAFAAPPALVVQAVRPRRRGGQCRELDRPLGRSGGGQPLTVALLAAGLDPATGFPRNGAFTQVSLIGAGACAVVVVVAVLARSMVRN